jgi:hypothetical protein
MCRFAFVTPYLPLFTYLSPTTSRLISAELLSLNRGARGVPRFGIYAVFDVTADVEGVGDFSDLAIGVGGACSAREQQRRSHPRPCSH